MLCTWEGNRWSDVVLAECRVTLRPHMGLNLLEEKSAPPHLCTIKILTPFLFTY